MNTYIDSYIYEIRPGIVMDDLSYLKPAEPFKYHFIKPFDDKNGDKKAKRFSCSLEDKSDDAIQVFLRIKPDGNNLEDGFLSFSEDEANTLVLKKKATESRFSFTHIFKPTVTQEEVFLKTVDSNLQDFFHGRNSFIFTYGTSSSGKTFTIQGKKESPGLIPRIIASTFATLDGLIDDSIFYYPEQSSSLIELSENEVQEKLIIKERAVNWAKTLVPQEVSRCEEIISMAELEILRKSSKKFDVISRDSSVFSIWFSFAEIYNERIYDLFDDHKDVRTPLTLSTDRDNKQPFVKGLRHICVTSLEEAYFLYYLGCYNRSVSSTGLNDRSSRSHSVFTIKVVGRQKSSKDIFFLTKFSVCDLAGTERFNKTRNFGSRMKESQSINSSFLVLNRCLRIIRENQVRDVKQVVPYRESKLTQIMGTSFATGETNLLMIVTVAQSSQLLDETEASLKSSAIATEIKVMVHSPEVRKKKMRFSAAFSHLNPGRGVNWKQIVSTNGNGLAPSTLPLQDKNIHLLEELEKERVRRKAAETKLAEMEKIHREQLAHLMEGKVEVERCKEEYQKQKEESKQQSEEYFNKYLNSRADILRVKKQLRLMKDDYESLKTQVTSLESTNDKLGEMLDDAKDEVEFFQQENKILNETILEKVEHISLLQLEISQLEENLEQNANERETYDRLETTLDSDLKAKDKEIKKLQNELEALEADFKNQRREISELNNRLVRSKSEEYINDFDDSDEPFLSPGKAKTTVKKKKRRQAKYLETSYYFDGLTNSNSSSASTGLSARRRLYKKTSEEDLGDPSDSLSGDNTQASPNTIFRTLRTGKKY